MVDKTAIGYKAGRTNGKVREDRSQELLRSSDVNIG
jgi:hypothetical protein